MIGGMGGNGALIRNDGTIRDFYQTAGLSYGFKGTYAFFFNQRGLMGGLGLQGSKITRIHPPR